jgi:4-amino-4-deoxy-L-arabinose transferase-like glycosyltransferase
MTEAVLNRTQKASRTSAAGISSAATLWNMGWVAPSAVFLLGLALRLAYINHESVGFDEAFSMTVGRLPLHEMFRQLIADFVHPPLHYLVLRGWFRLFGFGILQARLLSALFSTLAVLILYYFARCFFDRRTAVLSALLLSVSQVAIMFAQEPRPYAQFHFLVLGSSYLFVRALREKRALYWWGFVGSSVLMLYTDYFSVFVISALLLSAAIYRKRYPLPLSWVLVGMTITLFLYLPWLASGIVHAATSSTKTFAGNAEFSAVHWYTFLTAVNTFNNGKPTGLRESSPWWTFAVGGLLFCTALALCLKKLLATKEASGTSTRLNREGVAIAGMLWLLPLIGVIGVGYTLHIPYNFRYVSFCAPFYYILVACGISELRSAPWRWALVALILAYSANSLRANYFMQWKEDWRDAFAYVERDSKNGDCGIFHPYFRAPEQWTITQADHSSPFRVISQENLQMGLTECDRIWEISWALHNNPAWWASYAAETAPLEVNHAKIEEKRFFGVRAGLYTWKQK